MKLVLASRNQHKIAELEALLGAYIENLEILSLDDVGFSGDIEENGATFAENAEIKARAAASTGYIGLGDDSGLTVRALGGAPGIYSARYAGSHGDDAANNALLLKNLADKDDRYAEFVCSLCCIFPDGSKLAVEGKCPGRITTAPDGEGGFGYDPYFFYEELGKTFAALTAEEKNRVSHRGRAIQLLAKALKEKEDK